MQMSSTTSGSYTLSSQLLWSLYIGSLDGHLSKFYFSVLYWIQAFNSVEYSSNILRDLHIFSYIWRFTDQMILHPGCSSTMINIVPMDALPMMMVFQAMSALSCRVGYLLIWCYLTTIIFKWFHIHSFKNLEGGPYYW